MIDNKTLKFKNELRDVRYQRLPIMKQYQYFLPLTLARMKRYHSYNKKGEVIPHPPDLDVLFDALLIKYRIKKINKNEKFISGWGYELILYFYKVVGRWCKLKMRGENNEY